MVDSVFDNELILFEDQSLIFHSYHAFSSHVSDVHYNSITRYIILQNEIFFTYL